MTKGKKNKKNSQVSTNELLRMKKSSSCSVNVIDWLVLSF